MEECSFKELCFDFILSLWLMEAVALIKRDWKRFEEFSGLQERRTHY